MNKTLALASALLKNGFSSPFRSKKKVKNKIRKRTTSIIIYALMSIFIAAMMAFYTLSMLTDGIFFLGTAEDEMIVFIFSTEKFISVIFFIFFLGTVLVFFSSFSNFFLGQDNEILAAYPIKSSQIFIAKWLVSLFYAAIVNLILIAPSYIAFFYLCSSIDIDIISASSIIGTIIVYIYATIVQTSLAFIIGVLIMRVKFFAAHKQGTMIGLSIVLLIVLYIIIPIVSEAINPDITSSAVSSELAFYEYYRFIYYLPYHAVTTSFIYSVYMLIIIASSLVISFLLSLLLYKQVMLNLNSGEAGRKKRKEAVEFKEKKKSSSFKALTNYEMIFTRRNAMYFLNYVISFIIVLVTAIIFEAVILYLYFLNGGTELKGSLMSYIFAAVAGGFFLIILFVPTPLTSALSKDGETFYLIKSLPVKTSTIIKAKFVPTLIMQGVAIIIGVLFVAVIDIAFAIICLFGFCGAFLAIDFFSLFLETKLAIFNWQNEHEYLRRIKTHLVNIFIASCLIGVNWGGYVTLMRVIGEFIPTIFGVLILPFILIAIMDVCLAIGAFLLFKFTYKKSINAL